MVIIQVHTFVKTHKTILFIDMVRHRHGYNCHEGRSLLVYSQFPRSHKTADYKQYQSGTEFRGEERKMYQSSVVFTGKDGQGRIRVSKLRIG